MDEITKFSFSKDESIFVKKAKIGADLSIPDYEPTDEWKKKYGEEPPFRLDGSLQPYDYQNAKWNPAYRRELEERGRLIKEHPYYNFYTLITSKVKDDKLERVSENPLNISSEEERFLRSLVQRRNVFQLSEKNLIDESTRLNTIRLNTLKDIETLKERNVNVTDALKAFKDFFRGDAYRRKMILGLIDDLQTNFFTSVGLGQTITKDDIQKTMNKYIIVLDSINLASKDPLKALYYIYKFAKQNYLGPNTKVELPSFGSDIKMMLTFSRDFKDDYGPQFIVSDSTFTTVEFVNIFTAIQKFITVMISTTVMVGDSEIVKGLKSPRILSSQNPISLNTTLQTLLRDNPIVQEEYNFFLSIWNPGDRLQYYLKYEIEEIFKSLPKEIGEVSLRNLNIAWEAYNSNETSILDKRRENTNDSLTWVNTRLNDIKNGNVTGTRQNSQYFPTFETMQSSYNTGVINLTPIEGYLKNVYARIVMRCPTYCKDKDINHFLTDQEDVAPYAQLVAAEFASYRNNNPSFFQGSDAIGLVAKQRSDPWIYFRKKEKDALYKSKSIF